jgi:hypothetical protein
MKRLIIVSLVLLGLGISGCAKASVGAVICAADTESPHWSKTAQVLNVKTRYGCNQAPAAIQVEVRIERRVNDQWTEWHTESHPLSVAKANTSYTVYTSTHDCVPGTYRSGGRIVTLNGQPGIKVIDYASTPLFVDCFH